MRLGVGADAGQPSGDGEGVGLRRLAEVDEVVPISLPLMLETQFSVVEAQVLTG